MSRGKSLTLADVRRWPPAVNVEQAALALGVSRASLYQAIAEDALPRGQAITVGHRRKVLTHSLLEVLEGGADRAASA